LARSRLIQSHADSPLIRRLVTSATVPLATKPEKDAARDRDSESS